MGVQEKKNPDSQRKEKKTNSRMAMRRKEISSPGSSEKPGGRSKKEKLTHSEKIRGSPI